MVLSIIALVLASLALVIQAEMLTGMFSEVLRTLTDKDYRELKRRFK